MSTFPLGLRKGATLFFLVGSFALSAWVGTLSVAAHTPFRLNKGNLASLLAFKSPPANRSWQAVHILAASGCTCSRGVAEYLLHRGSLTKLQDLVILIGHDKELSSRFRNANLVVEEISAEEASDRYRVYGIPWLVILAPNGEIGYAGGYSTERSAHPQYQDAEIWKALQAGARVAPLPAYGCAVGKRMQRQIDPLGLKYGFRKES